MRYPLVSPSHKEAIYPKPTESNRSKFDLVKELKKLDGLSKAELHEMLGKIEEDLILLDTQLDCYESGVDTRSPLWYKQATYVYYGKRVLRNRISLALAIASDSYTALVLTCNSNEIPHTTRESNTRKRITFSGAECSVTLVFNNQGEFLTIS
jgi:hypothetical protein